MRLRNLKRAGLKKIAQARRINDFLLGPGRVGEFGFLISAGPVIARSNNVPVLRDTQKNLRKIYRSFRALERALTQQLKEDRTMENYGKHFKVKRALSEVKASLQSVERRLKELKGKKVKRLAKQP